MVTEKRLIDANKLVEKFLSLTLTVTGLRAGKCVLLEVLNKYRNGILQLINEQPTVDAVEVVHGRWEDMSDKFDKGKDLRCSICRRRASNFVGGSEDWWDMWEPYYCPNCGAKMDSE